MDSIIPIVATVIAIVGSLSTGIIVLMMKRWFSKVDCVDQKVSRILQNHIQYNIEIDVIGSHLASKDEGFASTWRGMKDAVYTQVIERERVL